MERYPECGGVGVLMLGSRLFFMPPAADPTSRSGAGLTRKTGAQLFRIPL